MKIEIVKWLDSSGPKGTWFDKDDAAVELADMTVQSVGLVVFEDTDRLVLSHSIMGDNVASPITIPKRAIVSRQGLGTTEQAKPEVTAVPNYNPFGIGLLTAGGDFIGSQALPHMTADFTTRDMTVVSREKPPAHLTSDARWYLKDDANVRLASQTEREAMAREVGHMYGANGI
jgi:hypothetical protein